MSPPKVFLNIRRLLPYFVEMYRTDIHNRREHCEVSHGDMLEDMSKKLSESIENTAVVQDPLLLEQPFMTRTQVPQPKLVRQNLSVDLFHKIPSHTTSEICSSGNEYIPRFYSEAGEKKIAPTGQLLGGREYKPRVFFVVGKGDTLFMLATECAELLGYEDPYLLFDNHRCLYKIILNQAETDDVIHQQRLPYSYRSRQIAIVTAKSMFRQFGSRIVLNGKRVYDDYWEGSARARISSENDMAGSNKLGENSLTEQVMKYAVLASDKEVQNEDMHHTSALYVLPPWLPRFFD